MLSFQDLMHDHSAIFAAVRAIMQEVEGDAGPATLSASLGHLDSLLTPHLAIEDKQIYPLLLAGNDSGQRIMAEEAINAYASLADDWSAFAAAWDERAIAADRSGFAAGLRTLLDTLQRRVRAENEILYPMALRAAHIRLRAA
ncbi:hemerythrin domain-containing protein [Sphingomonas sp.]|uniref:hemerythrin domain-containing protein n=1 Tax=Sphingomonas sp. TaxID=28214 RepID=UPI002ED823A5